jgi:hypothetical protein
MGVFRLQVVNGLGVLRKLFMQLMRNVAHSIVLPWRILAASAAAPMM